MQCYKEVASPEPKGILINFRCVNIFKEGQKTLVNNFFSQLPDE